MSHVKNKKAIANISQKSLKANKGRNLMAIFAIALTALMFTALFTVGLSMMKTMEEQTFRQVGTNSHGGYKFMTQEQYDTIAANPMVKDISYSINMGTADNPELQKVYTELRYAEDDYAEWSFCYPTTGTMPKDYLDFATSTDVLDALGVPHEVGAKIPISFSANGKNYSEIFTLSGFWEQDPVSVANQGWVSREYLDQNVPVNPVSIYDREPDSVNPYGGTISCSLWFNNAFNIDGKMDQLTKESGYKDGVSINSGVNWAYSSAEIDLPSMLIVVMVLLLIMVSGYLIIFNIFYISVAKDTRYYGLLKTIGTTGKQLKRIVRRQALLLSCIGIPIGLLLGYFVGVVLGPVVLSSFSYFDGASETSASPLIFIGAAIFALITVWISSEKPARLAGKVSPMEALRYNEVIVKKKKEKKTEKVSTVQMGIRNVFRSKKKMVIVILSLALSIILVNSVYSVTKSFDMDKYIENSAISDFSLGEAALLTRYEVTPMAENVLADMEKIDGVEKISPVYFSENQHRLSAPGQKNMDKILAECSEYFRPNSKAEVDMAKKGAVGAHIYGIDDLVFAKLENLDQNITWEQFLAGDYVISNSFFDTGEYPYYNSGDVVTLAFDDGTTKDYTVLAVAALPYAAGVMHSHEFNPEFLLPVEEYRSHYPEVTPLRILIEGNDAKEAAMDKTISNYCEESSLSYVSKATLEESLNGTKQMYAIVGGSLSGILALIGLLNFINTMVTSIYSRRRELAMLQSVGMTTKQLKNMLTFEGLTYVGLTMIFCLTVGLGISSLLTFAIAGNVWFFSYHFTMMPILCCLPIMLAFALIIPQLCYKNACKESIVERLREND